MNQGIVRFKVSDWGFESEVIANTWEGTCDQEINWVVVCFIDWWSRVCWATLDRKGG